MIGLRVEIVFHWGFWIRAPYTSRYQSSLSLPPPTTLIGALVNPLISLGYIRSDGTEFYEVVLSDGRQASPVIEFKDMIPTVSFYYKSINAYSYSDINRYIGLHYQSRAREKEREKTAGGRRYLPEYRFMGLKVGKVTSPSSRGVACYLINEEEASDRLGYNWKDIIQIAAYNINRIGSKESIVSVDSVSLVDGVKVINAPADKMRTRCYIPLRCTDESSVREHYYIETFWKEGWSEDKGAEYEDYLIPGSRSPISTKPIEFTLKEGKAYELDEEEVLVVVA